MPHEEAQVNEFAEKEGDVFLELAQDCVDLSLAVDALLLERADNMAEKHFALLAFGGDRF